MSENEQGFKSNGGRRRRRRRLVQGQGAPGEGAGNGNRQNQNHHHHHHQDGGDQARRRRRRRRGANNGNNGGNGGGRRRPKKIIEPFDLFAAYHLGLSESKRFKPVGVRDVARRFNCSQSDVHDALNAYKMDSKSMTRLRGLFEVSWARQDIKVAPEGIDRGEVAKQLYDEFVDAGLRRELFSVAPSADLLREDEPEPEFDDFDSELESDVDDDDDDIEEVEDEAEEEE